MTSQEHPRDSGPTRVDPVSWQSGPLCDFSDLLNVPRMSLKCFLCCLHVLSFYLNIFNRKINSELRGLKTFFPAKNELACVRILRHEPLRPRRLGSNCLKLEANATEFANQQVPNPWILDKDPNAMYPTTNLRLRPEMRETKRNTDLTTENRNKIRDRVADKIKGFEAPLQPLEHRENQRKS